MSPVASETTGDLRTYAFNRIANVLGPERAEQLLMRLVDAVGESLDSPQDLMRLSERMTQLGGFEAAVGAMLGVAAVMRGASPSR